MTDREIAAIKHIALKPETGTPVIAGTGINVSFIAHLMQEPEWTIERVQEDYALTPGQIYAALSYYADHKEAIEQAIQEAEQRLDEYQQQRPDRFYSPD